MQLLFDGHKQHSITSLYSFSFRSSSFSIIVAMSRISPAVRQVDERLSVSSGCQHTGVVENVPKAATGGALGVGRKVSKKQMTWRDRRRKDGMECEDVIVVSDDETKKQAVTWNKQTSQQRPYYLSRCRRGWYN
eukprot:GHVS01074170.1.p1 GENE.GHVS01074170.1~~GHVS01074170.1.p1  ORF type:complete len:134 (+),score=26.44 GHVS01074170.1:46-447(+)